MFVAAVRASDNMIFGCQSSPSLPVVNATQFYVQLNESDYGSVSDLSHPAGGTLKWLWNGAAIQLVADTRKTIRVSVTSQIIAQGTAAAITLSVLKADGTVDTTFNGQVTLLAQVGDVAKIFRIQFASGVKVVNVPTTNFSGMVEVVSSRFSLVESPLPITVVQDA